MVIWTDTAISHITEFIDEVREDTENTAKSYMSKLIDLTNQKFGLKSCPFLVLITYHKLPR